MASFNYFVKGQKAYADDQTRRVLVEVDAAYIPLAISALEGRKPRSFWASEDEYATGSAALSTMQEDLLMGIADIVPAIDRVYMAIRQASAGEVFTALPGGIPPVLPTVPPALSANTAAGLLALVYNQMGVLNPGLFGIGGRPATLADIVQGLKAGQENEMSTLLDKIDLLGDASDITSIYGAVKGTATDLAELAEGGGTLATLIVATLAQTAAAGLAAGQMDTLLSRMQTILDQQARIIASLDGGATVRPAGNILKAAEETRDLLTPEV